MKNVFLVAFATILASGSMPAPAGQVQAGAAHRLAIVERIPGPDGGWDDASVDAATRTLFLARNSGVLSLDLGNGHLTPVFVPGRGVHAALKVPGTHLGVSSNGAANTVTVFDARSGRVLVDLPVGKSPDSLVYEPRSALVAVMNHDSGSASLIDPRKRVAAGTIAIGGELEVAAASGTGLVFVNVADKSEIAVLDVPARAVRARLALRGCDDPSGLAYDRATDTLITVCANGVTKFLRATDGTEICALKTGLGSDGLILDERRRLLYVPAGRDGTLTVIGLARGAPKVLQVLKTRAGTRLGTVDSATGRVYLPSAALGPPIPPSPWPSVIPGSFHFLVVGRVR